MDKNEKLRPFVTRGASARLSRAQDQRQSSAAGSSELRQRRQATEPAVAAFPALLERSPLSQRGKSAGLAACGRRRRGKA